MTVKKKKTFVKKKKKIASKRKRCAKKAKRRFCKKAWGNGGIRG